MKSRFILIATLLFMFTLINTVYAGDEVIDDFSFDGCSSIAPEGTPSDPALWCECCLEHDIAYWQGGTYTDRLHADEQLRSCVAEKSQCPALGELYYLGVRAGGSPYFYTSYRWGYGFDFGRGYKSLSAQEQAIADQKIDAYFNEVPDPCEAFGN